MQPASSRKARASVEKGERPYLRPPPHPARQAVGRGGGGEKRADGGWPGVRAPRPAARVHDHRRAVALGVELRLRLRGRRLVAERLRLPARLGGEHRLEQPHALRAEPERCAEERRLAEHAQRRVDGRGERAERAEAARRRRGDVAHLLGSGAGAGSPGLAANPTQGLL